jgi:citrate lyase beta subunit
MRARRALLYMPGDDLHKIRKAATLGVDCICMDLEDGVAQNRKAEARATIAQALAELDFGPAERLVRINPIGSGLEADDLTAALAARPDGIVVPKVESAAQIQWVDAEITRQQAVPTALIVLVETALGIVRLAEIAAAAPRLEAIIFGAEDLAGDIGAVRTPGGEEVFYARSAIVTHAAAFGLQAIDMVFVDFHDPEGLRAEALAGARLGYSGKQIIHPAQVEPTQAAFTPSAAEIAAAQRLVDAFAAHQAAGRGAFALDGKMVDAPVMKAAARVLSRARAAGKAA